MDEPVSRVLIVGAGLGGVTLAAFLEQSGQDYLLVDKLQPTENQGYSLGIWSNTRELLKRLQLDSPLSQMGTPIHTYDICDRQGHLLRQYDFHEFYRRYGMAYTQIHRQPLRDLIGSKVNQDKIRWSTTVQSIKQHRNGVEVNLSPGDPQWFDLVVCADGVHSVVREQCLAPLVQGAIGWRA